MPLNRCTMRGTVLLLAASVCMLPCSRSLSAAVRPAARRAWATSDVEPSVREERHEEVYSWYDEDPSLYFDLQESDTSDFHELQRSTGSEILDARLQEQLDGISDPNQFLERHVADATPLEKIAMSSVTQQLPSAAIDALLAQSLLGRASNNTNKGGRSRKAKTLRYSDRRVTPEEEVELARIIQMGAKLEATLNSAQKRQGRSITRQELADLVGMSTKMLRREIARYRQAKHLLVTANIGLVGAVVNQIWRRNKSQYFGLPKEELMQEGSLGLIRAAELFDPSRGVRFSTYAVVWIKGMVSNSHVHEFVRLPDRERRRWQVIRKAQANLLKSHDGNETAVTLEALVNATGISAQDILFTTRQMELLKSVKSLDYVSLTQSRSGDNYYFQNKNLDDDVLIDDADMMERAQIRLDVIAAMARNLDAREARLMRLRYGLSDGVQRSLHECAAAMGLSYTNTHRLSVQCLAKLRQAAEAESLQEYLLTIA